MSGRPPVVIPQALSKASRRFEQWHRRHAKRTRLPKDLWREAAALAREHGVYQTAQALGLRYGSLKKHVGEATAEPRKARQLQADFIELLPGVMPSGPTECMVEWADPEGSPVRMHLKGAGAAELASLVNVLRGNPT